MSERASLPFTYCMEFLYHIENFTLHDLYGYLEALQSV